MARKRPPPPLGEVRGLRSPIILGDTWPLSIQLRTNHSVDYRGFVGTFVWMGGHLIDAPPGEVLVPENLVLEVLEPLEHARDHIWGTFLLLLQRHPRQLGSESSTNDKGKIHFFQSQSDHLIIHTLILLINERSQSTLRVIEGDFVVFDGGKSSSSEKGSH